MELQRRINEELQENPALDEGKDMETLLEEMEQKKSEGYDDDYSDPIDNEGDGDDYSDDKLYTFMNFEFGGRKFSLPIEKIASV